MSWKTHISRKEYYFDIVIISEAYLNPLVWLKIENDFEIQNVTWSNRIICVI